MTFAVFYAPSSGLSLVIRVSKYSRLCSIFYFTFRVFFLVLTMCKILRKSNYPPLSSRHSAKRLADACKAMNPKHSGSNPAVIRIRSRINPEIWIRIPHHFSLKFWLWPIFSSL